MKKEIRDKIALGICAASTGEGRAEAISLLEAAE